MSVGIVYCDGSCLGNPGKGGWASLVKADDKLFLISGAEELTSNNRMELTAAISGLKKATELNMRYIEIRSDSKYVCDGASIWIENWTRNNWNGGKVKNVDLWNEVLFYIRYFREKLSWKWVKAHDVDVMNIFVDCVARSNATFPCDIL
ncbi:ribonuclease H family protein [Candidatus Fokinia crypta]|uniref:ribonuclease H n=1 Tax=Candidatus Fokinia crypta TaxID=1920990 RepID=A0ABZ0URG5_9RICK|nr:ribonuclease H [Candidatus Fokinia cryptica]WPX97604.1 Ribonuclease H [Candidatus Fokinia cryptica]